MARSKSTITTQPIPANTGLPLPTEHTNKIPSNCPPGLDALLSLNQITVEQRVEIFETFCGCETNNQYVVKNIFVMLKKTYSKPSKDNNISLILLKGQQIYLAQEDTSCCTLYCCGANRPFLIKILDNHNHEVMHITRPLQCNCCCPPCCCLQYIEVEAPPGKTIGFVEQDFSCCYPKYSIKNSAGDRMLRIWGPFCTYSLLFDDIEFTVHSLSGSKFEIGRITKKWSGFLREVLTDADHFGVVFPIDLDVNVKALFLAAVFLIDFMFFEKKGNREKDKPGMIDEHTSRFTGNRLI